MGLHVPDMRISVIGAGYVGLSLATLVSVKHEVIVVDVIPEKVDLINSRISPISDDGIEKFFSNSKLNLEATLDIQKVKGSKFVIVATPTNYDPEKDYFDTTSVEEVLEIIQNISPDSIVVIKSTVPIGFTERMYNRGYKNILFSPEFLREGKALYDNLHPSRIVVGVPGGNPDLKISAEMFVELLKDCSAENEVKSIITGASEAESIKLFSNSYLAMRVAFFNELDSFAEKQKLESKDIINGVCMDSRIGDHYNNPSFGYGGYCLPKDTKQLRSNYDGIPNSIISAIVKSNELRKKFVADAVSRRINDLSKSGKKVVGVYRITMKTGSDNFRQSSVIDVVDQLFSEGFEILVYEPLLSCEKLPPGWKIEADLEKFMAKSDLIIANRHSEELSNVMEKVYTRDIFFRD